MHDDTDDRAGDVSSRAASENAIGGFDPHAGGGHEGEANDIRRQFVNLRQILGPLLRRDGDASLQSQ